MLSKECYDKGIIENSSLPLINRHIKNCDIFESDIPVPTNWDLSPQNWMVEENGEFTGFIDFENMLWGLALDSFYVITARYTFDKPHLKEAFFKGYGLAKDKLTKQKLTILSIKAALADISYGYSNNNLRFFQYGKRMLNKVIEECKL